MTVTAKDLRFNISMLFGMWSDREESVNDADALIGATCTTYGRHSIQPTINIIG